MTVTELRNALTLPATRAIPRVFLVAVDVSGDHLGAALMRSLKELRGGAIDIRGVGGPEMEQEGLKSLFSIAPFAIIGFAAIPKRLPLILRRIRETADAVIAAQVDCLVIIDCPDFSQRVARLVRRRDPRIAIINYVSPQVWAWRAGRSRTMRRYIDHILALLPFEPGVHQRLGGPACTYVGHPLAEQVGDLRPNAIERQRRNTDPPILLVLPGSRASEVQRLFAIFRQAVDRVIEKSGPMEVVIPTTLERIEDVRRAAADWSARPRIVTEQAEKRAAFRSARAALAKSGTVTLELALSGIPMVTAYRVSGLEALIARRVIRVSTVILANLVLGENAIPEFLQEDCTPEKLAGALIPLLSDTPERKRQLAALARLDGIMDVGNAVPGRKAAQVVLDVMEPARRRFSAATQQ